MKNFEEAYNVIFKSETSKLPIIQETPDESKY